MPKASTRELILLLLNHYGGSGNGVHPYEISTTGITDVLEIDEENISERMKLISTLSDMKEEGLIEEKVSKVEGFDDERNAYFLTEEGKNHAENLHDQVLEQEITVRDKDREYKAELGDVARKTESRVVHTLAKARNGVLDLSGSSVEDWFVDREEELDLLHKELVKVKRSGKRTVLVSGETGVGKTALLSRFEEVAEEKGFEFLIGKCLKGASEPYHSFRNAFDNYLDSYDLDLLDQERPLIDEDGEVEAQKTARFNEVTGFVSEIAEKVPLVVFIDDIHWIDRETLELFEFLMENVEDQVLFVGGYRPEDVPEKLDFVESVEETLGESGYLHIEIDNFGLDETRSIVERLVKSRDVPTDFVELVHKKTGGNPLFIRESVKQMIEEHVIRPNDDVYPSEHYQIPVPDHIEKTIERRLRSLDRQALEIVETCAVIGDEIEFELIDKLLETSEADLKDYLDVLQDTRIISGGTEEGFEFVNSVTKEAILENMSEKEKKLQHRKVGDTIEKLSEEKEWEEYERIGHHYEQAGELEEALEYHLEAGDRAKRIYTLEKALVNYERGLKIARELGDEETELSVVIDMGHTHYLMNEYDESERYFDYVWERSNDPETLMRASRYHARTRVTRGEHDGGIEIADRGLEEWDGETPSEAARSLLSSKGWALQEQGELEKAAEIYEKELRIAEEIGDDEHIGSALHDLGSIYMYRNELDEAKRALKESIERLENIQSKHHLSKSVNNLGIVYWKNGDLKKSRETFERSLEISEGIGDDVGMTSTLLNLGVISLVMGDWENSLNYYERALQKSRSVGKLSTLATVNENLGEVYLERGDLDRSLKHFERSIELSQEVGIKHNEIYTRVGLSRYHYVRDEADEAMSEGEKALELAEEVGSTNLKVLALDRLGRNELERGNLEKAEDYQSEAVELSEGGEERTKVETRCGLVKVYIALGNIEDAYEAAKGAVETANGMLDLLRKLQAERAMGAVLREKGRFEEAEADLEAALERSKEIGSKYDECETLFELVLLEKSRGKNEKATEYLEKGVKIAEECRYSLFKKKFEMEAPK